jgi:crossover junction endodeoxyribonuclease RuvC
MRILGIDPGLTHTGWGVVDYNNNHIRFVACGRISSDSKTDMHLRLKNISEELVKVINLYSPDSCAIEETFVNKNPESSLKLGHARGAAMLTVSLAGLEPCSYAATLVKKTVVGAGRADKNQIAVMVKQLLPNATITSEDAADALAIAICHSQHYNLKKILEEA